MINLLTSLQASDTNTITSGGIWTFNGTTTDFNGTILNNGDTVPTGDNPTIDFTGLSGTYSFTYSVVNGICSNSTDVLFTADCISGTIMCSVLDTTGTGNGEINLEILTDCPTPDTDIEIIVRKGSDNSVITSGTFSNGDIASGITWSGANLSNHLYLADGVTSITTFDANTTYVFWKRSFAIEAGLAGIGLGEDYIFEINYTTENGCNSTSECTIPKFFEGRDYWVQPTTSSSGQFGAFKGCPNTTGASGASRSGGYFLDGLFDETTVELSYDTGSTWSSVSPTDIFNLPTNPIFRGVCMRDDECSESSGIRATTIADPNVLANVAGEVLFGTAVACDSRTLRAAGNFDSFASVGSIPSVDFSIIEKHLNNPGGTHPTASVCPIKLTNAEMYIAGTIGVGVDPVTDAANTVYTAPFTHVEVVFGSGSPDTTTHTFTHTFPTEGIYMWEVRQYKENDYVTSGGNPNWSNAGCDTTSTATVMGCLGCMDSGVGADLVNPITSQNGLYVLASF